MTQRTEEDFEDYKDYVGKYLDYFGIKSHWHITYSFEYDTERTAGIDVNFSGRQVRFMLSTVVKDDSCNDMKKSAFHEVMELVLCDINHLIFDDNISKEAAQQLESGETHRVIILFENTIFKDIGV